MKIYVAWRTDVDPPKRIVGGNINKLIPKLRDCGPGAEFTVALLNVQPTLLDLCKVIESPENFGAEEVTEYAVNDQKQLRKVK